MGRRHVRAADGSVSSEERLEQLQDPLQDQRMSWTCHAFNHEALNSFRRGISRETDDDFSPKTQETWLRFIVRYVVGNPNQCINDYYDHLHAYIFKFLKRLNLDEYSFVVFLEWCSTFTNMYLAHCKEREREKTIRNVQAMVMAGYGRLNLCNVLNSINVNIRS